MANGQGGGYGGSSGGYPTYGQPQQNGGWNQAQQNAFGGGMSRGISNMPMPGGNDYQSGPFNPTGNPADQKQPGMDVGLPQPPATPGWTIDGNGSANRGRAQWEAEQAAKHPQPGIGLPGAPGGPNPPGQTPPPFRIPGGGMRNPGDGYQPPFPTPPPYGPPVYGQPPHPPGNPVQPYADPNQRNNLLNPRMTGGTWG